jgi:hypothetical protein
MNAKNQVRSNKLTEAYVTELKMDGNAVIHGAIRQVIKAKNTDETLLSLEFLLQTILKGQGQTDYIYNAKAGA